MDSCDDESDEVLLALAWQALNSIPNERLLLQALETDAIARWFVGAGKGNSTLTAERFSRTRGRLFALGIVPAFVRQLLSRPGIDTLLAGAGLDVDASLLEAWATQAHCETSTPTALASVLLLPDIPDALRHVPYLDANGDGLPIERVLRRLVEVMPGPVAVMCSSAMVGERLQPIVSRNGARLLLIPPYSVLTRLKDAAEALHTAHLALWPPGAALLPDDVLRGICAHHVEQSNDVTTVPELPEGTGPEIYSVWSLHRFWACAPRTVDFTPRDWLEWSQRNGVRRHGIDDLRTAAWPADRVPRLLPGRIAVRDTADWQRLAATLAPGRSNGKTSDWSRVQAWQDSVPGRPALTAREIKKTSRRGPRVLFVCPSVAFSGPERMFVRLTNGLLDRGVDLWGLVVRPGMIGALLRAPYRKRLLSDGVEFGHPTFEAFDYCLRVVRRVRPDLIHCNGVLAWPVVAAATACGVPVVQHVRTADLAGLEDQLRVSPRLIAVSRFVAGELHNLGIDAARVRVCHDGIDTGELRRTAAAAAAGRRWLGISPQSFVVLCISRITPHKRIDTVISAFARVVRMHPDAHLLFVGEVDEPPYYESLARMIAAEGLGSRVRFLQAVEDIRTLHAAADALVLASIREALGNAVLEAMSMQTPVVATESGGIVEMIDSTCGTLVPCDADDAFGSALCRIAAGDQELLQKARRARAVVRRRFHIDDHVDAIRHIYREAVR